MFKPGKALGRQIFEWGRQVRFLTGWDTTRMLVKLRVASGHERWQLAASLGGQRLHDSHLRQIIMLMDSPDALLRWLLEEVLISRGGKQVISQCRARLQAGGDTGGIVGCLRVLGALEVIEALPDVVRLSAYPDTHVRVAAAEALRAFLDDVRAQEALAVLLEDNVPAVRRAAVWALRRSDAPWAVSKLASLAQSSSEPWFSSPPPGSTLTEGLPVGSVVREEHHDRIDASLS